MNKFLEQFLKIGLAVASAQVPAIGIVEQSVEALVTKHDANGQPIDKKEQALVIVKNSPAILEAVMDKEILDDELFKEGISEANDAYVKIMKAVQNHTKE